MEWVLGGQWSGFAQLENSGAFSIRVFRQPGEDSIAFYSARLYSIFVAVTMGSTPQYQFGSEEWAVPHSPSSRHRRRLRGPLRRLNSGLGGGGAKVGEGVVVVISMPEKLVEITSEFVKNTSDI